MMIRLSNKMAIVLFSVLMIGFIVFFLYPYYLAHRTFVNSQYNFIIEGIEFRKGHHGVPHIKIDTGWYLLRTDEEFSAVPFLKVGDSLVKIKDENALIIYRQDDNGNWTPLEY